jgi:hypothetical protein
VKIFTCEIQVLLSGLPFYGILSEWNKIKTLLQSMANGCKHLGDVKRDALEVVTLNEKRQRHDL